MSQVAVERSSEQSENKIRKNDDRLLLGWNRGPNTRKISSIRLIWKITSLFLFGPKAERIRESARRVRHVCKSTHLTSYHDQTMRGPRRSLGRANTLNTLKTKMTRKTDIKHDSRGAHVPNCPNWHPVGNRPALSFQEKMSAKQLVYFISKLVRKARNPPWCAAT